MSVKALASIATALAFAQAAHAADGTINFAGQLYNGTCVILIFGSPPIKVTLPTMSTAQLSAAGQTAGDTAFNIDIVGCLWKAATAYFEAGPNIDTSSGRLKSTGTATNVQVQLLNANGTVVNLAGTTTSAQGVIALPAGPNNRTVPLTARYYATGATTPGSVSSSVTFSLAYP